MTTDSPNLFLRRALYLDAGASILTGLLLLFGAGFLAELLGLPVMLLRIAGLSLFPFVAFVAWTARQGRPAARAVWSVIGMNTVWVVASVGLLFSSRVDPTLLGNCFVIVQAAAVVLFTELQFIGLRKHADFRRHVVA